MTFFSNSFRPHIQSELERRLELGHIQDVFFPHIRVTSMVKTDGAGIKVGDVTLPLIKGFTLGPHNLSYARSLDTLMNINADDGCLIGTTYDDGGKIHPVIIPKDQTYQNLPSPGITDVTIDAKGGLMFKATIKMKFYGKQQYDAIYQLFMKPGRVIAIEFGHTTTKQKDLKFFEKFNQTEIDKFVADYREFKPVISDNPNSGVVVGAVSNFSISLNDSNEYEATIDLVNGLEYVFTLPIEETYLNFRGEEGAKLSKSIKENFGMASGNEYTPRYDCVYNTVRKDSTDPEYSKDILWPDYGDIRVGGLNPLTRFTNAEKTLQKQMHNVYVGLDYLFQTLLPKILSTTEASAKRIHLRNLNSNETASIADITYGKIGKWDMLRSNNIKNVIINNVALYGSRQYLGFELGEGSSWTSVEVTDLFSVPFQFKRRAEDYKKRFPKIDPNQLGKFFKIRDEWTPSKKTTYNSSIQNLDNNFFKGIFINYAIMKNSIANSNSLSEAIIKILNTINAATSDILKLKLQIVRDVEGVGEPERLVIYDEREVFRDNESVANVYKFFKNNKSEAISYKFDFSLPSSVATTVVGNKWRGNDDAEDSVGDSEASHLLRNGYVVGINDMEQFEIKTVADEDPDDPSRLICGGDADSTTTAAAGKKTELTVEEEIEAQYEDELYQTYVGYQELVPSGLKSQLIYSGNADNNQALYDTLPTGAKVTITLQGLHGFRFGDLFFVENVLPYPYSNKALFYLLAWTHNITSDGWTTTITGQFITITPQSQLDNRNGGSSYPSINPSSTPIVDSLPSDHGLVLTVDPELQALVGLAKQKLSDQRPNLKMVVISGYRNEEHNRNVGGAKYSLHLQGRAIDVNLYAKLEGGKYKLLPKPRSKQGYSAEERNVNVDYVALKLIFDEAADELGITTLTWGGNFENYDPNHYSI